MDAQPTRLENQYACTLYICPYGHSSDLAPRGMKLEKNAAEAPEWKQDISLPQETAANKTQENGGTAADHLHQNLKPRKDTNMTTDPNLPQFYRKPVMLNRENHSGLTVTESPTRYAFAAGAQTVLMATVEFFDACRSLPIIFTRTGDGRIVPLALMGLEQEENLFVDGQGNWTGAYIPAYIRRYPFITTDGSEGQMTVCFDEEFDGFNREGGMPLFVDGEPAPKMKEIVAFLQDYYGQIKQTEQFGAFLAEAGLLRQIDGQANMADGRSFALNGMLVVEEQKLASLPDMDIVRLFRSGSLALINAHLLSLRNLGVLIDRKAALT